MPNSDNNGQNLRLRIVKAIDNYKNDSSKDSSRLIFICLSKNGIVEEIFSCNEILQYPEE